MTPTIRLRFLAHVNPPTPEFERHQADDEVTFVPLEAVWPDQRLDLDRVRPYSEVSTGYVRFRQGDILSPKVTPTFQAGRSAIAGRTATGVGAASSEVHVLRAKPEVDTRFVRYALLSARFLTEGVSRFQGVAGLQRVPDDFLRDFEVAHLAHEEQRRIADFLDDQVGRMDEAANLRASQLRDIQANLLRCAHSAVTGNSRTDRVPSGVPWAESLPSDWPVAKLSLVARLGTGHTPSRSEPEYWLDCSIPWVTTSDVKRFRSDEIETIHDTAVQISDLGLRNSAAVLHRAGTVALCRTSGSAGYSIVMGKDMATSQDMATWTCGPYLDPYFLLWVLRASRVDLLDRLAMGSTHKTIYFPDLEMLRIPLPPLAEQKSAVECIRTRADLLRELRRACARSLALMEERKRALITACVSGDFDVSAAGERAGNGAMVGVAP